MMKFSFSQASMKKGIQKAMGAVSSRVPMPSLNNFLMRLEGNRVELTATDLEVTVTAYVELLEHEGSGGVLVPAKKLQELVNELPDIPLEIEVQEGEKVALKGVGVGRYLLPGGDPLDFPETPNIEAKLTFKFGAFALKRMINKTLFAVSKDEMRPVLTGLLFQVRPGELRLVSTDGHRLSRIINHSVDYKGDAKDIIIPMKALNLLTRNIDDEDIPLVGIAETRAYFQTDEYRLITRLIDGSYPRYENVIPEQNPNRLSFKTGDMMATVKRVAIFSSQISRQIKFNLSATQANLDSEDQEQGGQALESVAVDFEGEPLEIAYNANYLMDALRQVDTEETVCTLGGTDDAALIRPSVQEADEDFLMLLMPIRLR